MRSGLLLSGLLLAVLTGCNPPTSTQDAADQPKGSTQFSVIEVVAEDHHLRREVSATIEGFEAAMLMSKIDGFVERVNVNIGDSVTKGQVLATLHVPELLDEVRSREEHVALAKANIDSHKAMVELAKAKLSEQHAKISLRKIELERTKRLVGKGALTQQKLDEAQFALASDKAAVQRSEAEIDSANAQVASAKAQLGVARAAEKKARTMADYCEIRAPFDGLVASRMVDPGKFVRPASDKSGTAMFNIVRVDKVRIVIFLPMEDARWLDNADGIVLRDVRALPGVVIKEIGGAPLKITRHADAFDQGSRMMRAEIDIDNEQLFADANVRLKPGDYGKVDVTLHTWPQAPTVPSNAVGGKDTLSVMVVDAKNQVHQTPVEILTRSGDRVALASGAKAGQNVVEEKLDQLTDGQTITRKSAANGK